MIKAYNVARDHGDGVEIIQIYPYLTLYAAEEIRETMEKTFGPQGFVVLNMETYFNPEGIAK
jgi:hypothetical protein